jgi:alpha-beta hydrolase superfamily lysophospholipase
MAKRLLEDEAGEFELSVLESPNAARIVLFAVGGGGDPERHLPLLQGLAARGCTVVAPHAARITTPSPSEEELLVRARRLRRAVDAVARPGVPVAGVGHSIGATLLLALAGGAMWMRAGHRLSVAADARLDRLALLAPATGYYGAPGALDAVRVPVVAWLGGRDTITPPAQAEVLRAALEPRGLLELRVADGAGHFSFMNRPPPHTTEPLADREAFLAALAADVAASIANS